jgi:hypothetical protein
MNANPIQFIESGIETLNLLEEFSLDIFTLFYSKKHANSRPKMPWDPKAQTPNPKLVINSNSNLTIGSFL